MWLLSFFFALAALLTSIFSNGPYGPVTLNGWSVVLFMLSVLALERPTCYDDYHHFAVCLLAIVVLFCIFPWPKEEQKEESKGEDFIAGAPGTPPNPTDGGANGAAPHPRRHRPTHLPHHTPMRNPTQAPIPKLIPNKITRTSKGRGRLVFPLTPPPSPPNAAVTVTKSGCIETLLADLEEKYVEDVATKANQTNQTSPNEGEETSSRALIIPPKAEERPAGLKMEVAEEDAATTDEIRSNSLHNGEETLPTALTPADEARNDAAITPAEGDLTEEIGDGPMTPPRSGLMWREPSGEEEDEDASSGLYDRILEPPLSPSLQALQYANGGDAGIDELCQMLLKLEACDPVALLAVHLSQLVIDEPIRSSTASNHYPRARRALPADMLHYFPALVAGGAATPSLRTSVVQESGGDDKAMEDPGEIEDHEEIEDPEETADPTLAPFSHNSNGDAVGITPDQLAQTTSSLESAPPAIPQPAPAPHAVSSNYDGDTGITQHTGVATQASQPENDDCTIATGRAPCGVSQSLSGGAVTLPSTIVPNPSQNLGKRDRSDEDWDDSAFNDADIERGIDATEQSTGLEPEALGEGDAPMASAESDPPISKRTKHDEGNLASGFAPDAMYPCEDREPLLTLGSEEAGPLMLNWIRSSAEFVEDLAQQELYLDDDDYQQLAKDPKVIKEIDTVYWRISQICDYGTQYGANNDPWLADRVPLEVTLEIGLSLSKTRGALDDLVRDFDGQGQKYGQALDQYIRLDRLINAIDTAFICDEDVGAAAISKPARSDDDETAETGQGSGRGVAGQVSHNESATGTASAPNPMNPTTTYQPLSGMNKMRAGQLVVKWVKESVSYIEDLEYENDFEGFMFDLDTPEMELELETISIRLDQMNYYATNYTIGNRSNAWNKIKVPLAAVANIEKMYNSIEDKLEALRDNYWDVTPHFQKILDEFDGFLEATVDIREGAREARKGGRR